MRLWHCGVGFSLSLVLGVSLAGGCSAGNTQPVGTGGSTTTATSSGGNGGSGAGTITTGDASADGFSECAKFNAEAKQAPAAMLIVLDRTASMSDQSKWGTAQLAIVQAIDKDDFDTMSLGMLTFPAPSSVPGPACIFGFPIYCGVSTLPQVQVKAAGTDKSSASTGVRKEIYDYLVNHSPEGNDPSDSSPIYPALNGAYQFLKGVPNVDKRVVVLITDGGGSCTSVSSPTRPAYFDGNGCADWEQPPVMAKLIDDARQNAQTPINTFIVGVPGSDSFGNKAGPYDTPPYHMRLALSTYAVAGSPETVDPTCDKAAVFAQGGADPAKPCHIDLSNNASFNPTALADAITSLRGKALACTYDLPTPPSGGTVDPGQVNVVVTTDGTELSLPKRKDASDACATEPCWDYNATGQVELIGLACTQVSSATNAKVQIFVGCATIIK